MGKTKSKSTKSTAVEAKPAAKDPVAAIQARAAKLRRQADALDARAIEVGKKRQDRVAARTAKGAARLAALLKKASELRGTLAATGADVTALPEVPAAA